ncbi:MAG TPA: RNA-binding protein [Polyangiaceae bacterium]|nr:RNA-binding protein [Polyangiaceae bacterium]
MGSRLYVGNLSYSTTEDKLRVAFEPYGTVASATIMIDRMSGRSRGFGFVEFANEADAKKAIEALNGADVDGRALTVNEARAREEGARGGGSRPHRSPAASGGGDFGGGGGESRGGGGGAGGGRGRRGGDRDRRRHDDNDW